MTSKNISLLLLLWLFLTVFLAYNTRHLLFVLPLNIHPVWALLTVVPIVFLLLKKNRAENLPYRNGLMPIVSITVTSFLGLGHGMGFIPFSWHQYIAWAFSLFLGFNLISGLVRRKPAAM